MPRTGFGYIEHILIRACAFHVLAEDGRGAGFGCESWFAHLLSLCLSLVPVSSPHNGAHPCKAWEVNLDTRLKERTGDTCTYANPIAYLATLAPVTSFLDPWHALYMQ